MSGHSPRKRFGQHFLTDSAILDQLVRAINPESDDVLVEIGPGTGILTDELIGRCAHLYAVELDRDLAPALRERYRGKAFTLIEADALSLELSALALRGTDGKLRVAGNLPYNISTPLLFRMLDQSDMISDMVFMVQKEVAKRLAAHRSESEAGDFPLHAGRAEPRRYLRLQARIGEAP